MRQCIRVWARVRQKNFFRKMYSGVVVAVANCICCIRFFRLQYTFFINIFVLPLENWGNIQHTNRKKAKKWISKGLDCGWIWQWNFIFFLFFCIDNIFLNYTRFLSLSLTLSLARLSFCIFLSCSLSHSIFMWVELYV